MEHPGASRGAWPFPHRLSGRGFSLFEVFRDFAELFQRGFDAIDGLAVARYDLL